MSSDEYDIFLFWLLTRVSKGGDYHPQILSMDLKYRI